jgi:CheY-like chemotaxis protein
MTNRINRTILIVDDDLEILAYYFKLFEAKDMALLDILGDEEQPRRWHPTIRHYDPLKFDEMFEKMVRYGVFHPVCLVDLRMPVPPYGHIDPRRGVATARHVRGLDPRIHIIISTADPDADGAEIVAEVGGSTHFYRRPFKDGEEQQFCAKVRELIDSWNGDR